MISDTLIAFVKAREGCKLKSYWDPDGKVWTVCYGDTGADVDANTVCTQAECDAKLLSKLQIADNELLALSPGPYPPGAQDALTDFVYNEGSGRYKGSTLRTYVDAGNWAAVKTELLKWEFAGGKKLAGLENRREGEASMINA